MRHAAIEEKPVQVGAHLIENNASLTLQKCTAMAAAIIWHFREQTQHCEPSRLIIGIHVGFSSNSQGFSNVLCEQTDV
jgi:hypothetical protein